MRPFEIKQICFMNNGNCTCVSLFSVVKDLTHDWLYLQHNKHSRHNFRCSQFCEFDCTCKALKNHTGTMHLAKFIGALLTFFPAPSLLRPSYTVPFPSALFPTCACEKKLSGNDAKTALWLRTGPNKVFGLSFIAGDKFVNFL